MTAIATLPRPDIEYTMADAPAEIAAAPVPAWRRLAGHDGLRRAVVVAVFLLAWEIVARLQDNDLMLP